MNVCDLLAERAKELPMKTALVDRQQRVSYGDVEAGCAQADSTLLRRGVRWGDAALILVPLSTAFYVTVIALLRIGAIPVLVDPGQGRSHLERCCKLIRPRAFIGSALSHLLLASSPALRQIPLRFTTSAFLPGSYALFSRGTGSADIAGVASHAPALVTFTSGSTGAPKAIARSHGFLLAQHKALQGSLDHAPSAMVCPALPVFGLSHLSAGLSC